MTHVSHPDAYRAISAAMVADVVLDALQVSRTGEDWAVTRHDAAEAFRKIFELLAERGELDQTTNQATESDQI
jgi:hypothetical protein